jgi:hypothetical protein
MHGAPFFDGIGHGGAAVPILLCVQPHQTIQRRPGVELLRGSLPVSDITEHQGLRLTTPVRTAFDLARRASHLFAAVAALDTLLECGLIALDDLCRYVDRHPRWRGIARARLATTLAVEGVRSPPETWMRLTWEIAAGLPGLLVNRPVFDLADRLLGIADALDPESATVLEYDGEDHLLVENAASDAERDRRFAAHGLRVLRITKRDLSADGRDALIERMHVARVQGLARNADNDRWTITTPDGWTMPG